MGKEEVKIINSYIDAVVKPQGFYRYHSKEWVRRYDDVINVLSIDSHGDHFNCDVAVLPLCVPWKSESITIDIGNRIERFEKGCKGIFPIDTEENLLCSLKNVETLLRVHVFDWYNSMTACDKIIRALDSNSRLLHTPPGNSHRYLGYMSLYLGNIERGKDFFRRYYAICGDDTREWAVKELQAAKEIERIADEYPEKLKETFEKIIAEETECLKLAKIPMMKR